MKHKSKQLLSVILSLCMVLSLFAGTAVTAYAADDGFELNLATISETNLQGAIYAANGIYTNTEKGWTWDSSTKTLTLNNCEIKSDEEKQELTNGIKLPDEDVKLILTGVNTILAVGSKAISGCEDHTLTISGDGSLKTGAGSVHINCGNLVLQSGSVTLAAELGSGRVGVSAKSLTVNGGTLSSEGFYRAILAEKVTITGGHVTATSTSGGAIAGAREITVAGNMIIMGGDDVGNAMRIPSIGGQNYLDITAPAAATFADGFGGTVDKTAADTYVKGQTTNDKGYTFDGWVDDDGNAVNSTADATPGVSYTARWAKNGKTVRTAPLDLTGQGTDLNNTDEGWSWNAETKTLTLSGATFDVPETYENALAALTLPEGATLTTTKGTTNTVRNASTITGSGVGCAVLGGGDLTVAGEGTLSVTGKDAGLCVAGDLTVNAPISASCAERTVNSGAVLAMGDETPAKITVSSSLSITTPRGAKIESTANGAGATLTFITDSDGTTAAQSVVIGLAAQPGDKPSEDPGEEPGDKPSEDPGEEPGDKPAGDPGDKPADKPAEKPADSGAVKTGDAGIALYAGLAAAAVLGCGVALAARKRKEN